LKNGLTRWTYGIGSVILRKTLNKEERYYIDYQINGRRVRKTIKGARTRTEAVRALNSEIADVLRGKYSWKKDNSRITFAEMAELFLEKYSKVNKRSWKTSDWVYLRRLNPYFGSEKLLDISTQGIEEYKSKRLSTGIKKSSVNRELSCLRKIFNVAIAWGYASENPVRKVKFFSENGCFRERILMEDEEDRLLDACPSYLRPIVMVALHSGMRKGEILKLKWKDVDLDEGEIKVTESKSGKARILPVNSTLRGLLLGLKSQNGQSEYVFENPKTGKPFLDLKRSFSGACRKVGIENLRFHDLRHTFASRLVKKGADLMIVKELMGHSSVVTTQRYTHSQAKEKMAAVETLAVNPRETGLARQIRVKSDVDGAPNGMLSRSALSN